MMFLRSIVRKITLFTCLVAVAVLSASAQTTAETKHLRVTASASADHVKPGQRISLTLDIELKPDMHVYAPSVEGYIPISWTMAPSDAIIVSKVVTPPSKMLRLPAIDETLPVYGGRFKLVRDITIASNAKGEITAAGTLRYQACDDRMCYLPKTVPLTWTLRVQ
jgi:DsbC/DsbD-like thiol-disulfide interchange protein